MGNAKEKDSWDKLGTNLQLISKHSLIYARVLLQTETDIYVFFYEKKTKQHRWNLRQNWHAFLTQKLHQGNGQKKLQARIHQRKTRCNQFRWFENHTHFDHFYISSLRKREEKLLKNLPLKGLTHVGNSSAMQGMSKCGHKFKMGVGEYATGLFSSVKSVSGYSSRRAKIHSQPTWD